MQTYGAFVKLEDGLEGLVHQSCLSHTKKNPDPSKILSTSQSIKVKILQIDSEQRRISLSYKDNPDVQNPWEKFIKEHN